MFCNFIVSQRTLRFFVNSFSNSFVNTLLLLTWRWLQSLLRLYNHIMAIVTCWVTGSMHLMHYLLNKKFLNLDKGSIKHGYWWLSYHQLFCVVAWLACLNYHTNGFFSNSPTSGGIGNILSFDVNTLLIYSPSHRSHASSWQAFWLS